VNLLQSNTGECDANKNIIENVSTKDGGDSVNETSNERESPELKVDPEIFRNPNNDENKARDKYISGENVDIGKNVTFAESGTCSLANESSQGHLIHHKAEPQHKIEAQGEDASPKGHRNYVPAPCDMTLSMFTGGDPTVAPAVDC
jgi:hypothetical protein